MLTIKYNIITKMYEIIELIVINQYVYQEDAISYLFEVEQRELLAA
jgi:hypothetical protein